MLTRQRRDTIPTSPGWQAAAYHPEQAQARRKQVNDRASKKRRAVLMDIWIGDQAIINDQKPVWKLSTPYEPGLWTVTRVSGTMVTEEKGRDQVTRNISWFRKVTFEGPSDVLDGEDYLQHWSRTGDNGPESENELPFADGQSLPMQPVPSVRTAGDGKSRSPSGRYNLRPNPPPSQRLKDFCL
ncbi:hypothetical protein NDU88_002353 [Pleurodeles waltl]|uniref:Uncharacterized protein n=1 Tax=Pleurodeles waltl TaxID=8319 RepID=A0AAV7P6S0_PLEWA|nr:hypothetical protein NDU88_002353 [Pleurodeles waltl]